MKFSKLSQCIMTRSFTVAEGEEFTVTWDANKFNGELDRREARTFKETSEKLDKLHKEAFASPEEVDAQKEQNGSDDASKVDSGRSLESIARKFVVNMELNAVLDDINKVVYADALACDRYGILKDWQIEDEEEKHLLPTYDALMVLQSGLLQRLFTFCRTESLPKKVAARGISQNLTTSEITESTSLEKPTTQAPESLNTSETM